MKKTSMLVLKRFPEPVKIFAKMMKQVVRKNKTIFDPKEILDNLKNTVKNHKPRRILRQL